MPLTVAAFTGVECSTCFSVDIAENTRSSISKYDVIASYLVEVGRPAAYLRACNIPCADAEFSFTGWARETSSGHPLPVLLDKPHEVAVHIHNRKLAHALGLCFRRCFRMHDPPAHDLVVERIDPLYVDTARTKSQDLGTTTTLS